jgi:hypothetical protein
LHDEEEEPTMENHLPLMINLIIEVFVDDPRGFNLIMSSLKWDCEGWDSGSSFLWYTDHSSSPLDSTTSLIILFSSLEMAPRGRKPSHPHSVNPSHVVKVAIDAVELYEDFVPKEENPK